MNTRRRVLLLGGLIVLLSLPTFVAAATDAKRSTPPYVWRSWTRLEGLRGSQIWAITQDHAGYIWLGTNQGLVRFDGVRFVAGRELGFDQLPDRSVRSLFVARDGSLWAGFGSGGISRIQGRTLRNFTAQDGLPPGVSFAIVEDPRGDIWSGSANGLYRLRDGRWTRVSLAPDLPTQAVDALHCDRSGRVWVATRAGVYRSMNHSPDEFERLAAVSVESFAEDAAGHVWGTGDSGLTRLSTDPVRRIDETAAFAPGRRLVTDREGRLWVGTLGDGLVRVDPGDVASVDQFKGPAVLSNDVVRALFEDREGNIWVGTPRGLDRGSRGLIRSLPEPGDGLPAVVQAVAAATDGSVWVGTVGGLYRFSKGMREDLGTADLRSRGIVALHGDAKGRMWVATGRGIGRFEKGRYLPLIPVGPPLNRWVAMATDRDDTLWLCDLERGLFTWDGRTLVPVPAGRHGNRAAFSIHADRNGRIWTGHVDGTIAVHDGGESRIYTSADGLPGGMVTGFYEDAAGEIWAGAVGGLMKFRNGRFDAVTPKHGLPGNIVTAISGDRDGMLWLGVSAGIVRLRPSDFDAVVAGRVASLPLTLYEDSDGLRADPLPIKAPVVARGEDGRMWFLTSDGVAVVSPEDHEKNRVPPPVVIETIAADQQPIVPGRDQRLPPLTANLRIDYSALSFVAPEKIRFSYLMEGFDADWIDAGTRRQAFYTNLPPGDYRFRVKASNDGVVSEREAVWAFSLAPAFYQSRWFAVVMGLLALSIGALAWRARVHQVRGRFSAILIERTRVAREIHDTLLQSLLGVLFRLDEVANMIHASNETAKQQIVRLRHQVEFYVREARYSIRDLRSPILQSRGLPTALRAVGERLTGERTIDFRLHVAGVPRADLQRVDEHLLRIGQEAITNAVRHGKAATIRVELHYRAESVVLSVRDDGTGFDARSLAVGDGVHWGLRTMRERADLVGGTLTLESAAGQGTTVQVTVPIPSSDAS